MLMKLTPCLCFPFHHWDCRTPRCQHQHRPHSNQDFKSNIFVRHFIKYILLLPRCHVDKVCFEDKIMFKNTSAFR